MGEGKNFFVWILFALFAILLIVAGFQGSAGKMLAVALVPGELDVIPGGSSTGKGGGGCPQGTLLDPMTGACIDMAGIL